MTADELTRLLEAGDLYGLMLRVTRAWLERDHPETDYATLIVRFTREEPDGRFPVMTRRSSSGLVPLPS